MQSSKAVPPPPGTRRVWGACPHDCPDTCAMVIDVKDGPEGPRAVRVGGDPAHPVTRGALCVKVNRYLERTYSEGRVLQPLRRVGKKGEGRFERVSWDEALRTVAAKVRKTVDQDGGEAILPYSYAGTMGLLQYGSMDRRFFHHIGASHLDRTICSAAGEAGTELVMGGRTGTPPEAFAEAKVIFLWGTNTITSNVHLWPFVLEAKKNGATVVAIDPRRTKTAERSDRHVALHPGTDAALAMGMMHVLFRDGLADLEYLKAHTDGWEGLRERVLAKYAPERTDHICGLEPGTTESLARLWASTRKAVVRLNYGLQRHRGGASAVRAIHCLPAVSGSYREYAGGACLSTSGAFKGLAIDRVRRQDWVRPGLRTINMSRLGEALLDIDDPRVKMLVVYNSNPAAVAPDQNRVTEGLLREDLFTVVLEQFATDTMDYADIVLPATTQLEHNDLHTAYGHYYLTWNEASIPPLGDALPNVEIFRRLAAACGFDDPAFRATDEDLVREALDSDHPHLRGITLDRLKEEHWVRLNVPERWAPFADGSPYTASGRLTIRNDRAALHGLDPLPDYVAPSEAADGEGVTSDYDDGVPTGGRNGRHPLRFISPPAHHFLNSTFVNVLAKHERPKPWLEIHPDDAAARGIRDGDEVLVFNDRGQTRLVAEVSDITRPGTVVAPSVWWRRMTLDGFNANALTSERVTDAGGGATFYDCAVDVRKA